jgi:hypothetical protein
MHVELVWNIILGRATMKKTLYARRLFCLVMEFIIFFAGIFKLGIPTLNRVILRRLFISLLGPVFCGANNICRRLFAIRYRRALFAMMHTKKDNQSFSSL